MLARKLAAMASSTGFRAAALTRIRTGPSATAGVGRSPIWGLFPDDVLYFFERGLF
jgi:hypothetical protein